MKFPKYYINEEGVIHTVFAETGKSTCNSNYVIRTSPEGFTFIQTLWDEFVLHDSLKALAVRIEE